MIDIYSVVKKVVEKDHEDLGEYRITVSKILTEEMSKRFVESWNNMPSNTDPERFKAFKSDQPYVCGGFSDQGFKVKRKVYLGDKIMFID